ncbi:MAG TPA: hypothetical protein PKA10_12345 [Selenomonadales bacterium]|nr:hypothetical protein [Selenomonadales bacterium]
MENLVIQAYRTAKSKDLYTITQALEKLLRKKRAPAAAGYEITIGQVREILHRHKLEYIIRLSTVYAGFGT